MPPVNGNKVLIKRSDVSSNVPELTALELGELGVNTYDGKIFTRSETPFLTSIKEFLNSDDLPYVYNESLSGVTPKDGGNTITEVFSNVLGGYNNDIGGGGSTVINGEDNDIYSDFSIIGSGLNNKILSAGDYSFIAGGQNNLISHSNVFTLGSNLSSHANNFTYVNNLSVTGSIYANDVEITGGGGSGIDSGVRSLTSNWDSAYTTVQSNSATTWNYQGTDIKDLSANWENTYLNQVNYLPLSGGTITGSLSVIGTSKFNGISELGNVENTTATIYIDTSKVGINTETPNEELTIVGDVSATGKYYGDGSSLTGIATGDTGVNTLVKSNSGIWNSSLPLSGGTLTGSLTVTETISASKTISMSGSRVISGYFQDTIPVYTIRVLTQLEYNNISVKDNNTIYFIKE